MADVTSIVSSIVSVILAIVAIALSVYFFVQSKSAEQAVTKALAEITTQTEALQRLTGRWMDRLTRYVTEPRPADETLTLLIRTITEFPANIASQLRPPAQDATEALGRELVNAYIAIYYYVAVANVMTQGYLPPFETLQPDDPARRIVDQSFADFGFIERILSGWPANLVPGSPLAHLYTAASTQWRPLVRDSTMVYQARQEERR